MKKIYSIMMLAATVAAASCQKSNQPANQVTISATCPVVESEDTKTYLKTNTVIWAQNDAINVMAGTDNKKYTLSSTHGSTTGTFSGDAVTGQAYAVYPYDAAATLDDGTIITTLAAQQNARSDGFGNNTNLAVAKADAQGNFAFKNVCGLIKFEIKGDNIGQVVITGNNDEYLAGQVMITFDGDGNPGYEVVEGSKSVTIKTYNNAVMTPGTYYAVVLPQTFTKGITVTCKPYAFKAEGAVVKAYSPDDLVRTGSTSLTLSRAKIKPLGNIDKGLVWSYGPTKTILGALRGTDKLHGHYLDMSTGRTIFPLGADAYRENCDFAMVSNCNNGHAPCSITAAGAYANATNLGKLGTPADSDYIANWPAAQKTNNWMSYVKASELSDEQYAAITTVAQIKDIYDAHSSSLSRNLYGDNKIVTNANRGGDFKYLVIKTEHNAETSEGVGYGIIKVVGIAGGTWYIELNYKWGLEK